MLISSLQLLTVINHVLQVACKHVEYDTLLVFLHLAQMRLTQLLRKLAFDLVITQISTTRYHGIKCISNLTYFVRVYVYQGVCNGFFLCFGCA